MKRFLYVIGFISYGIIAQNNVWWLTKSARMVIAQRCMVIATENHKCRCKGFKEEPW